MLGLDISIVFVANPSIEHALSFTPANLQWTVTAYALTFGGFLLLGGRIADLYGRRRSFVIGMAGFTLASIAAGVSQSSTELIISRAAQGLFAAIASPSALSLLATTFAEGHSRRRAYGAWAAAGSFGGVIGNVVGGVLTGVLGWRSIFLINVPIGFLAVAGALLYLSPGEGTTRPKLDLAGAVSATCGLGLVVYTLGAAQANGWASDRTIGSLALVAALLAAFLFIEKRVREPLLPLQLVRGRASVGFLIASMQATVVTSTVFLQSLYMQDVYHYSPAQTGLAILPLSLGVTLGASVAARAVSKLGTRLTGAVGLALLASAVAWMARAPTHGHYASAFLPAQPVLGFGLALGMVSFLVTVTSGVQVVDQGIVAGIYNMSNQMGSSVGLAIVVTIASAETASVHTGGILAEASGIRLAFLVSAALAFVASAIAAIALRSPSSLDKGGVAESLPNVSGIPITNLVVPPAE
jgi:EmrB/QacA subfamily drug resistance transporter